MTDTPWHMKGSWAPIHNEITATDLKVSGSLPDALNGTNIRTGPNTADARDWFQAKEYAHEWLLRCNGLFARLENLPVDDPYDGKAAKTCIREFESLKPLHDWLSR